MARAWALRILAMAVTELPLFSMLKTRMRWLETRQRLLAENVANAETPGYQGRDLRPQDFSRQLQAATSVQMISTNAGHLAGVSQTNPSFQSDRNKAFEVTPRGNNISLEEEMMRIAQNQVDHQTAATLYSRSLGLIKAAIGKR
jgi:flagellar basal-body rod protein FlgB